MDSETEMAETHNAEGHQGKEKCAVPQTGKATDHCLLTKRRIRFQAVRTTGGRVEGMGIDSRRPNPSKHNARTAAPQQDHKETGDEESGGTPVD